MTEKVHAICSPSGAHGWMRCVGWESDPRGSADADEGTAAHSVAEMCLTSGNDAAAYIGRVIEVGESSIVVTDEMAANVQQYVNAVRAQSGELFVEVALPIGQLTGEEGATGTADAVVIFGDTLQVHDYKNGYKRVSAEKNPQLAMYALGALELYGMLYDFKRVQLFIHQPKAGREPSMWETTLEELTHFRINVEHTAARKLAYVKDAGEFGQKDLNPGTEQCQWCKHKPTCPALASQVAEAVQADFADLTAEAQVQTAIATVKAAEGTPELGRYLALVDLVESWCAAVRARAHSDLEAGLPVPGYKLVQGKKGARKWSNEAEAEAAMKSMRLKVDEMYDMKIISPTSAEKLLAKESPRRWSKLQGLVTQSEGNPTIAAESDPRPALKAVAEEFVALTGAEDLV